MTVNGTPVGTHVATPLEMTSGWPCEVTRTVPTLHIAVAHGPPEFGGNGQPATVHGPLSVTVAWPPTVTRGFGTLGVA